MLVTAAVRGGRNCDQKSPRRTRRGASNLEYTLTSSLTDAKPNLALSPLLNSLADRPCDSAAPNAGGNAIAQPHLQAPAAKRQAAAR